MQLMGATALLFGIMVGVAEGGRRGLGGCLGGLALLGVGVMLLWWGGQPAVKR